MAGRASYLDWPFMCRLFALHAGDRDVATDFWLLDAPDSMARQSEVNADGYGLAALTAKQGMIIMRNPVQAGSDSAYQAVAQRLVAAEMIVHLRYATDGETNASLRKGDDVLSITDGRASELLADRRGRGPAKKAAKKAPAKKAPAKKAPAKKAATKRS